MRSRLAELFDPLVVKRLLEEALDTLAGEPVSVHDPAIEYCKTKPPIETVLAVNATLHWPRSGVQTTHRFSCTMLPRLSDAESLAVADAQALDADRLTSREDLHRFSSLVAIAPSLAAVVRVFPADRALPALAALTDPARMAAFFGSHLPECVDGGWEPRNVAWDVVHYKPGRLCTLRYVVALERGSRVRLLEFYGKTFRDERWRDSLALLKMAAVAARDSGAWRAAEPVAASPQWRFTLQSAVPGRRFSHLFAELTHDEASEAELRQAEVTLRLVARAACAIHRSPITSGPQFPFGSLLAAQNRNLEYLGRTEPALAGELIRLQQALLAASAATTGDPLAFAHGDFAHGNVLVDRYLVGVIDFDRACQAEPAYDLAYFLTHLTSFGIRHPRRRAHVERLCETFRQAALEYAPEISPRRLALYEALDLSAYVLRNFRKQSHQAKWLRWAPEQIAAAWDRIPGVPA